MFTAGGVLAVLLIWGTSFFLPMMSSLLIALLAPGVVSEDLLVHGELGNRTLLFYVGVLSVVVGIARGLVPDDNFVFQPQLYLDQVSEKERQRKIRKEKKRKREAKQRKSKEKR
jgi:hypothetical protein